MATTLPKPKKNTKQRQTKAVLTKDTTLSTTPKQQVTQKTQLKAEQKKSDTKKPASQENKQEHRSYLPVPVETSRQNDAKSSSLFPDFNLQQSLTSGSKHWMDAMQESIFFAFSSGQERMDSLFNSNKTAHDVNNSVRSEVSKYFDQFFGEHLKFANAWFKCRTIHDVFDFSQQVLSSKLDHYMKEYIQVTDAMFKVAGEHAGNFTGPKKKRSSSGN